MINKEYTPEKITKLNSNEVFVFGSNQAGKHGKGAAKIAFYKFGAKMGQGNGLMGQSYGISTKDKNLKVLSLLEIKIQINKFIKFATKRSDLKFFVTKIGCGLAGYSINDIASLFVGLTIPKNVILPKEFEDYLESLKTKK